MVLPYINMNLPQVYTCSHPETPSHLVPHTIPLGHPSAPAPNILYHASNWSIVDLAWTAKRPNQSILKEISPGCSLKGMMLKLKLQYFGHLMRRVHSLEKTLMLGGIWGRRRRGRLRIRWLDASLTRWMWVEWSPGDRDGQGGLVCCDSWGRRESDTTEQLSWTWPWVI